MSNIEKLVANGDTLSEARTLYVTGWADIASRLPEDLSPEDVSYARTYFRAQLRLARGQKRKARRIFEGLRKTPEQEKRYNSFEDRNLSLLAAIDIAVRGTTNIRDASNNQIVPLFKLNGS